MNTLIFILVLILLIIILCYVAYFNISKKIKRVSKDFLGTDDIVKGLKQIENESKNTPLSVSGGNNLYLPRIQSDFPDYHKETMEEKVKQFVIGYLNCLEKKSLSYLNKIESTENIRDEINSQISDLKDNNEQLKSYNIIVHAISIVNYTKTKELATVKYQISLEYLGNSGKVQVKYEVDVSYLFEDLDKDSFSLRCNHCGGSLNEESNICEYCGTIVVRNISKVWLVSNFKKLRQIG